MRTPNRIYFDWLERYLEQIDVDFSVDPPGVEEINEAWQNMVSQDPAPSAYNWLEVYLNSLDDLYATGEIDYSFTVEEFNELLRKTMLTVIRRNKHYNHIDSMIA